ncbi:tRNA (cytosine(72)-C(5))-methyltransferase NSUN6 isoform X1 [Anguilla anguilla]|uniref:tRNA (cytosine(72)-C(5))-methyltransferase NSUN6 isoform X1 n=2 Tax=Anguilla anguilla TaxID=7936 RepID=UPI0015ABE3DC|nr:tRNA (cytosine(72)-C(5))-methyltransferase NSUN6 isoform X1 [Anguilla anguilla]
MSLYWGTDSMLKKSFVFPKPALRPEVQAHLRNIFTNKELVAAVGHEEAESRFDELLCHLSHPPSFTCVRVSTHMETADAIRERLRAELRQMSCYNGGDIPILSHSQVPDVLLLPVIGPRPALPESPEVIVGAQCGNAVLRGAHVFAPGILSAPKHMKAGDRVSVFSDVEGRCTRGAKDFQGKKVFVGNGVAEMGRADIFCSDEPVRGVGIRMVDPVYLSPSFDDLLPSLVFLQNLPSVVVSHVLGPRPGERVLDMCAAPGGKTTHIGALMKGEGEVVALDKISAKVERIRQNAQILQLDCIKAYCFNSTQAVRTEHAQLSDAVTEGPPFPEESFDRVLLDAPCSGLGQRPNMGCSWSLREIRSYQPLQRKLFHTAVRLLKRGGVLVYSTCTVTLAENEEQVAWALDTFPCLTLQPQEPHIGGQGMLGAGLSHDQLRLLQRFSPVREMSGAPGDLDPNLGSEPAALPLEPARLLQRANADTIGFFIAKFAKT